MNDFKWREVRQFDDLADQLKCGGLLSLLVSSFNRVKTTRLPRLLR